MIGKGSSLESRSRSLGRVLQAHVLFPLFAVLMLAVVWFGTIQLIMVERAIAERKAADSSRELIETYDAQMLRNLAMIDQALAALCYAYELRGRAPVLSEMQEKGLLPPSLIFTVGITDRSGGIVASTGAPPIRDIGWEANFTAHKSSRASTPLVSFIENRARIRQLQFSRRLEDANGAFSGIAMVSVAPEFFTSGYERSRLGEHGLLGIVGQDGAFLAKRTGEDVTIGQSVGTQLLGEEVYSPRGGALVENSWDGIARYTNARRLYGFPLTVVVGLSREEQLGDFRRQRTRYLWSAAGTSLLLAALAFSLGRVSWQLEKTRRRKRRDEETYYAASEASLDAVLVLQHVRNSQGAIVDFTIESANSRVAAMFETDRAAVLGSSLSQMMPHWCTNGIFDEFVQVSNTGIIHEQEWHNDLPEVKAQWIYMQVIKVEIGVVVILRDISERKLSEARIRHMAHHDALTGLPNRTLLEDRLRQAMLHATRVQRSVAVVFMDLDNFKLINDSLGHRAGDDLLKAVAERMTACVRQTDTVMRLGGDEFVLLLVDHAPETGAIVSMLQKIRDAIAEPIQLEGQSLRVTSSMGLAMYPGDGEDGETLLMNADAAMYQAKALGRNNYQFYTAEMNHKIHQRLALQEGLRTAIARREFFLVYQPQIDLVTGRATGVEALIRWRHPERGLISPLEFIGLAEETGMIVPIGRWVLREACMQNKAWQDAGWPPVTISVNVSARQFRDRSLIEDVRDALAESGLEARYLELELTESLIMQEPQQAQELMRELQRMGILLSIDDFGTGYSNLSALKSFPIARLKLDKSFVRDLTTDEDDRAIAKAVISLGHELNLKVLAEGVETWEQLRFLQDSGCDQMQGYLISRPVAHTEVENFFTSDRLLIEAGVLESS